MRGSKTKGTGHTVRPKHDNSTLVRFAPTEYLKSISARTPQYWSAQRTISCILNLTNWSAHSKLVISTLLSSPPGPGGNSTVLVAPMEGDMSTRNIVTVYCSCVTTTPQNTNNQALPLLVLLASLVVDKSCGGVASHLIINHVMHVTLTRVRFHFASLQGTPKSKLHPIPHFLPRSFARPLVFNHWRQRGIMHPDVHRAFFTSPKIPSPSNPPLHP